MEVLPLLVNPFFPDIFNQIKIVFTLAVTAYFFVVVLVALVKTKAVEWDVLHILLGVYVLLIILI